MDKREALYKDVSSLEVVAHTTRDGDFEDGVIFILEKLDAIPVADVQPVRYGKWKMRTDEDGFWYYCSECKQNALFDIFNYQEKSDFCPNCGAKMDGD